ncbi:CIC11C00000002899 [Sungouiella intermedia]|uniref:CIC11C00000002899 n=1 Tax=Sungouiella intermedia TaxID=45354 RepID=A0A1L0DRG7_9ASCO|nr:CIC11C00000002899 [[Candida] intermedia]
MGLFNYFKPSKSHDEELKEKGFEIAECSMDCASCTSKFPSSVSFNDDDNGSLWGSTKPYGLHIVIPTNQADWPHNALDVSGSLQKAVDSWSSSAKFPGLGESTTIKVNVSSLSSAGLESNEKYMSFEVGDMLLLPFFVWIKGVKVNDAGKVLDRVVPDLIASRDRGDETFSINSYPEFPGVTLEVDPQRAYIFLCSHRTRDKRCGITAPIMRKEMEIHLREVGLYRDASDHRTGGVRVGFINHIGGHKYAANVIIYLRKSGKNIWLARCKPDNVVPIIDECILEDGKVWPEKVRQVQKFKPIEW